MASSPFKSLLKGNTEKTHQSPIVVSPKGKTLIIVSSHVSAHPSSHAVQCAVCNSGRGFRLRLNAEVAYARRTEPQTSANKGNDFKVRLRKCHQTRVDVLATTNIFTYFYTTVITNVKMKKQPNVVDPHCFFLSLCK